MSAVHFRATGIRTLCGSYIDEVPHWLATWPAFLSYYDEHPDRVCKACLRSALVWSQYANDLRRVDRLAGRPFRFRSKSKRY